MGKHRAVKGGRVVRPLDKPKADNHAARHEAKKKALEANKVRSTPENGSLDPAVSC